MKWALLALALLTPGGTLADAPLHIVVPFAPGGGGDLLARVLAPELSKDLGGAVVVENVPGANGAIGMQRVARATRSQRIVVLASDHASVLVPLQSSGVSYDTKDFTMVGSAARYRYALVVRAEAGATTLHALAQDMRARGSLASIAVPAEGGMPELITHAVSRLSRTPITMAPFRGGSPAAMAALAGQVTAAVVGAGNVLQLHRDRKLRILAVSGGQRMAIAPQVPTFEEVGLGGFGTSSGWFFHAAKGTSMDVAALNRALQRALVSDGVRARLTALGLEPTPMGIDESEGEFEQVTTMWRKLLRERKPAQH